MISESRLLNSILPLIIPDCCRLHVAVVSVVSRSFCCSLFISAPAASRLCPAIIMFWFQKEEEILTGEKKKELTSSQTWLVKDRFHPVQGLNRLCYQRKLINNDFFYDVTLRWFHCPTKRVRQKDSARKSAFFCIHYFSKTKSNPAKKTTEQCVSGKAKLAWQNSAIFEHFQK